MSLVLENSNHDQNRTEIRPRFGEPHGYGILFDIPPDRLTDPENIVFVSAVLKAEHEGYKRFSQGIGASRLPAAIIAGNGEKLLYKPQPSSRGYMHICEEGVLEKVTSPIAFSHAGGMETAGVVLRRGPYDSLHDANYVERFRKESGEKVNTVITGMSLATT
ncbi:MAG: hypothetical protein ACR2LN_05435 [Candidatus Levyibacteriota bacterium]